MTIAECPREQEVVDVVTTGQWPVRCDAELRAHVASCRSCTDLADILVPVGEIWTATRAEVHPPAAGMVWWRAQMRARQEAARAAARPVTIAQAIGVIAAVVAVCAAFVVFAPWLATSVATSGQALIGLGASVSSSTAWVATGLAAAALLGTSLAVYFVVAGD